MDETTKPAKKPPETCYAAERFRENVNAYRKAHKLTLAVIADAAKIHKVTMSLVLAGKNIPTLPICQRIADALGVPIEDLFGSKKKFRVYLDE
jgi:transcriptional regulator with XRE-family HTH domain